MIQFFKGEESIYKKIVTNFSTMRSSFRRLNSFFFSFIWKLGTIVNFEGTHRLSIGFVGKSVRGIRNQFLKEGKRCRADAVDIWGCCGVRHNAGPVRELGSFWFMVTGRQIYEYQMRIYEGNAHRLHTCVYFRRIYRFEGQGEPEYSETQLTGLVRILPKISTPNSPPRIFAMIADLS